MSRKLFFATVAFVISVNFTDHAFAGANDYVFEPVKAEVSRKAMMSSSRCGSSTRRPTSRWPTR
jgi:hypothetical protein